MRARNARARVTRGRSERDVGSAAFSRGLADMCDEPSQSLIGSSAVCRDGVAGAAMRRCSRWDMSARGVPSLPFSLMAMAAKVFSLTFHSPLRRISVSRRPFSLSSMPPDWFSLSCLSPHTGLSVREAKRERLCLPGAKREQPTLHRVPAVRHRKGSVAPWGLPKGFQEAPQAGVA